MLEERVFTGGMDSDSDDRYVASGDYRTAYCIRNSKKTDDSSLTVTNTKGTKKISHQLGSGVNKVIGAVDDTTNGKIYFFIWNQQDYHKILEYNSTSEVITPVLESSLLNFREESKILSPLVVDGVLYFTDGFNHPRKLNIERFKSGNYPSPLLDSHINNIVAQHVDAPSCEYITDGTVYHNNLRKTLWQFRVQNIDWDDNKSAWGTASKFIINQEEGFREFDRTIYPVIANNAIDVTFNTGDENIRKIRLAVRSSNEGDFLLVKEFDKDELGLADNSTHTYRFYNDRSHLPIDPVENIQVQDFVPLKAKDQSLLGDSRRLGYFNINENFDPVTVDVDMDYSVTEYPLNPNNEDKWLINPDNTPNTTTNPIGSASVEIVSNHDFNTLTSTNGNIIQLIVRQYARFRTSAGDVLIHDEEDTFSITATGTNADVVSQLSALVSASTKLNKSIKGVTFSCALASVDPDTLSVTTTISVGSSSIYSISDLQDQLQRTTWNVSAFGLEIRKGFKRGSKHPVGLVYYDDPGRRGLVNEDDSMNFYIPFHTEDGQYGPANLKMSINHTPPDWATKYQVVYAGSDFATNFFQFAVQNRQDPPTGSNNKNAAIIILDLEKYDDYYAGASELAYSFTKGDRLRLIKRQTSLITGSLTADLFSAMYDYEVLDYNPANNTIAIRNKGTGVNIWNGDLIEVYTPKLQNEERLYYEIGEVFDILDAGLPTRRHAGGTQDQIIGSQPAIIELSDGDIYWRPRRIEIENGSALGFSEQKYYIEDLSFSDFYPSRIWDKMKPNKVDRNVKNIDRPSSGYFSNQYVPETFINGLSTFYDASFKYYDINNGSIQKVDTDDDRLIIFQEQKVGFSLINKAVLNNADGSVNGTLSALSQVLSNMNYYAGDYGIGENPESYAVYGGYRYFVDANRGAVLKLGGNGIQRISSSEDAAVDSIKMNKYFTEKLRERKKTGRPFFIYGAYHKDLEEYVISFDEVRTLDFIFSGKDGRPVYSRGEVILPSIAVAFSEDKGRWVTEYPGNEFMVSNLTGLVSFRDGQFYQNNSGEINNWYDSVETSSITAVFNDSPNSDKFFKHIIQKSSSIWECTEIKNQYGQSSNLIEEDFEEFEGKWKAAFLQDENTPNINNPLLEGDDLRCHSLIVKLDNNSTSDEKLFSVVVGFSSSELNN